MRGLRWLALVGAAILPTAAHASPEVVDQLEPEGGQWEVEWQGYFGGEGEQGFEALYGLNDRSRSAPRSNSKARATGSNSRKSRR